MGKRFFSMLLVFGCFALSAENVVVKVDTKSVGEVTVSCADAGSWTFEVENSPKDGKDYISISLVNDNDAVPPVFNVSFTMPQKDMHHLWSVNGSSRFYLPPAWRGSLQSNLASGMPLYQVLNDTDRNRLTISCDEVFRDVDTKIGVKEEDCELYANMSFFLTPEAPIKSYKTTILLDTRDEFWAEAIRQAAQWMRVSAHCEPCHVPEAAFEPLYSTWYQFHQSVFQDSIEAECQLASRIGMKTIIVDDGWQTDDTNRGYAYCGDWQVSKHRFPQMTEHVERVHGLGMRYMLWYSMPFVGYNSENFSHFEGKYLYYNDVLKAAVLDPRFPEVREFLVNLYVDAMKEWGLDGFKLDFIDSFCLRGEDPAIAQNYEGRDIKTVPAAVDVLMREVHDALVSVNPDVLIEFRQKYVGTAIAQYGNMFRVGDCPGDLQANRIGICNLRLTSGPVAIHSDMIEWNVEESAAGAARAILSSLFGVIQYSVMLKDIPQEHIRVIEHWLNFSQKHRNALLKGEFYPHHPEAGYPVVESSDGSERIIAVYQEGQVVDLCSLSEKSVYLINASSAAQLVVDAPRDFKKVEIFDAEGNRAGVMRIKKGLSRVNVPESGYIVLR